MSGHLGPEINPSPTRNLNLKQFQFFHGSQTHTFNVGDVIDPRDRPEPTPLDKPFNKWTHRTAAGHLIDDDDVRNPRIFFARNKGISQSYAAQNGAQGHVYQVDPLGPYAYDQREGGTISSSHPVRVVREVT